AKNNVADAKSLDTRDWSTDAPGSAGATNAGPGKVAENACDAECMNAPSGYEAPKVNHDLLGDAALQIVDTSETWRIALEVTMAAQGGLELGFELGVIAVGRVLTSRTAAAAAAREAVPAGPPVLGICFAERTPVHTGEGLKPIEEVEVGDEVWAWDEETGKVSLRRVVRLFETPNQPIVEVTIAHANGAEE